MGALFNFIITVFIIVVLFRMFFFYILPWLLKRKIEKMQSQFNQRTQEDNRKEGDVHVDKSQKTVSCVDKDQVGEYVDYDEVD